jgi:hypothetical protein
VAGPGPAVFHVRLNVRLEKLKGGPYYAPNPLRGGASSFAKASEDMSKGARDGRGGEENFEIRNLALRRSKPRGLGRSYGGFKVEVYSLDRSHIAKAIPLNKPTM